MSEKKKRLEVAGYGQLLNEAIGKHNSQQSAFLQHESTSGEDANALALVMGWALANQVFTLASQYQTAAIEWEKSKGLIMLKRRTESAIQQTNVLLSQAQDDLQFWLDKAKLHDVTLES